MFKIIAKTALKTLLALLIALILAFGVASLGFPGSMAGLFEKMEWYSLATGYSSLQYTYSGKTDDLARCVQNSISAENDKDIINYGDKLLTDENFNEFCQAQSEKLNFDYNQFVCGKLACAKYREGDKDGACEIAKSALQAAGSFPANNAFAQLCVEAAKNNDKPVCESLRAELTNVSASDGEQEYYGAVVRALEAVINL